MKPKLFKGTCSVCGQRGLGTIATVAADWNTRTVLRHANPEVCIEFIKRKKL